MGALGCVCSALRSTADEIFDTVRQTPSVNNEASSMACRIRLDVPKADSGFVQLEASAVSYV